MNVIVSIKQVPETTKVKINKDTNTLIREGTKGIINPFDMYAIEEGLRIREKFGGNVTAISMGPPQAVEALREAVSYGVDEAILLSDRAFAGADTWATSRTLAKGVEKIGNFDIIICGKQAIDGDTAQVGPGIAEELDIPFVAFVRKIREMNDCTITVERMMDDGYDVVELTLPALITVVKEINEPRMPSLRGKMRAKSIDIPTWGLFDLGISEDEVGLKGSATQVIKIFTPERSGKREILEGSVEDQVDLLINKLNALKVV
ncbi:MAG: electron transfer flavoprotein subunit beta/FixA family protein [Pseudomonadota bacterium]